MFYLVAFLVSFSCIAGGFFPVGKQGLDVKIYSRFHETKEQCEEIENHACFDIEKCDLEICELIDNVVLDFIKKEKPVSCLDEADCLAKESEQICDLGKVIRTESEVYCAVEAYKKDGVKLVESEAKKAAKLAADKAMEDAEKAKEDKCKNFTFKGSTIAQLRAELNENLECK